MPELPEVETTRLGIAPHLQGRSIVAVTVRERRLRWPVPVEIERILPGQVVSSVGRRAKYLLFRVGPGWVLAHLGMSGSLRLVAADTPPGPHDHVDLRLDSGWTLRLRDPRRFGAVLWTGAEPDGHPLLRELGPEPLGLAFTGEHLYRLSRRRRASVKAFLMDGRVVAGVGNIYCSESLHRAGIDPRRAAGRIAAARYGRLAAAVREVLGEAIGAGGTTLRDFVREDGHPGYFRRRLAVYGRTGAPCPRCGAPVRCARLAQRSTFFCPRCQH